ncbi:hypothetical protein FRC01_007270 [Tulasnella sp. 417]|nr:hypothetical protein FRC01_007270 [Tulasnella sp. 417]
MAAQQNVSGVRARSPPPETESTSTPADFSTTSDQNMCLNCRAKPKLQGHDYCGKACADWAKANRPPTPQPASTPMPLPPVTAGNSTTPSPSSTIPQQLCRNCRVKPKFGDHDYCGKTPVACADWAKSQENAKAQTAGASGPPDSAVEGPNSPSSSSSAGM